MTNSLTLYDSMRAAVEQCRQIDEVAEMRDKATALAAYARQRDDKELDVWMSEIRLRACMRIGELSRELEKARPNQGHGNVTADGSMTKTETLQEAGVSLRTAERYEQLVGPPEQQAEDIVSAAAENYFAKSRDSNEPATIIKNTSAMYALLESDPEPAASGEDEEFPQDEVNRAESARQIINRYQRKMKELYNVDVEPTD
jgi:hypothetical protein